MKMTNLIATVIISASLALGVTARAALESETPVEMKDLPEAVQKTIKDKAGDTPIVRIAKETRNGKEVYEAVVNKGGKETALRVDPNGNYLGSHEEKAEHPKGEKGEKTEKY